MSEALKITGLRRAEKFVGEQRNAGNDVRWDGWDMVFFRPSELGITSAHGVFHNGEWGFDNRVVVDTDGVWAIDYRNVRRTNRARTKR